MKKILVVLTGGTIGSRIADNIVGLSDKSELVSAYEKEYGTDTEFEIVSPIFVLSENLKPHMWNALFNTLLSADLNKYSGIIITHGTDTLSYTSAMAGLLLGYANIPVVLVASGKPIGEKDSNGIVNFRNAVCLIKQNIIGVFTVYSDNNGTVNVYLATRLSEANRYNDSFSPLGNVPYGIMNNEKFVKCNDKINDFELKPIDKICDKLNIKSKVMIVNPYPGLDYDAIIPDNCTAVLHTLYHSATADEKGLADFAQKCYGKNIGVYLCCFKNNDTSIYSSMKNVLSKSVVPLYGILPETAYAKLLIAADLGLDTEKFMQTNIYHEII